MMATLLLTRPTVASQRFLTQVEAAIGQPVKTVISPLIKIEQVAQKREHPPVAAVILTSENGARAAGQMGFDPGTVAYTVGARTAEIARTAGFKAISADADADGLVTMILARGEKGPLLHLKGQYSRGDIAPRLSDAGIPCTETVVYQQNENWLTDEARTLLAGSAPVVLPLFSPRTVTVLAGQGPFDAPLDVIAMSDAVASPAKRLRPLNLIRTDRPDAESMVQATVSRLRALAHGPAA